jgi:hapalindole biogenesis HpiC1 cyclase-like protein
MATKARWFVIATFFLAAALGSAAVATAVPVTIGNSSFETPELSGNFAYTPAGATWSFAGNAGISGPPSAFGSTPAPDGDQYAFLQTISSFSQQITLPADGTYVLTFFAAGRVPGATFGGTEAYQALLDADVIFPQTTTDNGSPFVFQQSSPFFATAGLHTLTFQGLTSSPDQTAFIDAIAINSAPVASVPEPSSILVVSFGAAALPAIRRLRAKNHSR